MTTDEKLAAILAAVQTDPGNRGLARDPHDNLFTATKGDFENACRVLAENRYVEIFTGFIIPSADPPCFETDGPLGAVFLWRALKAARRDTPGVVGEQPVYRAMAAGIQTVGGNPFNPFGHERRSSPSVAVWIERAGAAADGRCYTMRGRDITDHLLTKWSSGGWAKVGRETTIGIGDGGNEIGMGKIPHETIVKNIPNGDLIHCRVPTDHLIVAGVSNWGAYALAAGVYVLRGVKPPPDLFDPAREREILEVMVREGPLVDGVTGKQTATVDGLTWEEYARPLIRIREILEA
jgi:hypothetical protein